MGISPLKRAVIHRCKYNDEMHLKSTELLLQHPDTDVNLPDRVRVRLPCLLPFFSPLLSQDGETPLMDACSYGCSDVVQLLVNHPSIDRTFRNTVSRFNHNVVEPTDPIRTLSSVETAHSLLQYAKAVRAGFRNQYLQALSGFYVGDCQHGNKMKCISLLNTNSNTCTNNRCLQESLRFCLSRSILVLTPVGDREVRLREREIRVQVNIRLT